MSVTYVYAARECVVYKLHETVRCQNQSNCRIIIDVMKDISQLNAELLLISP